MIQVTSCKVICIAKITKISIHLKWDKDFQAANKYPKEFFGKEGEKQETKKRLLIFKIIWEYTYLISFDDD